MIAILKKILSVLMVILMVLTAVPLSSFVGVELPAFDWGVKASATNELAATGQCGDNVYWEYDSDTGELVISGSGPMWDYNSISSPFSWNRYIKKITVEDGITGIGDNIFCGVYGLTSVNLGKNITSIGDSAFASCTGLVRINFLEGLKTIGNRVFDNCHSLENAILPDSIISIGDYAFFACWKLKDLKLSNKITHIGKSTFSSCESLSKIIIPDNITTIADSAFSYCKNLTSVEIGKGVSHIGQTVFYECDNLNEIVVDDNNDYYSNDDRGVLFDKDKTLLIQYPVANKGKSYNIPNTVTSINFHSFTGCNSLQNITIPASLTYIDRYAFSYCNNISKFIVDENNMFYSSDNYGVLFNKDKSTLIRYPSGNERETYNIPETVTHIGESAFNYCDSITKITMTDSVRYIREGAFLGCNNLSDINLSNHLIAIDSGAFEDCISLIDITIGSSVKSIGSNAFFYCKNLKNIKINEGITSIGEHAFQYCVSLENVVIPDSVIEFGKNVFCYCDKLENIAFGSGITSISANVFYGCISLEEIIVDAENKNYSNDEYGVLFDKEKTTLIKYPVGNKRASYEIPEGVTTLGFESFYESSFLINLTIPNSVSYIDGASICKDLKYICWQGTQEEWNNVDISSKGNESLVEINIHFKGDNSFSKYIDDKNATCTTNETKTAYCPACGAKDTVEIENTALGHDYYVKERIEATCTLEGKVVFECKRCNVTYEEAADKLEHKWNEGYKIVTQPTCTQEGIEAIVCTVCDSAKEGSERSIEKLPHKFTDWSTEGNKSTRYCEVCNYTETKINTDGGDIEIEAPEQSDGTDFVVDEIVTGGKDYVVIEEAVSNGTDNSWEVIKAFDINLKNHDGVHVQPNGTVKVKLPNDWSKDGNYKVYRVNDDCTLTDMNAYRQGSHLVFDTDHFSIYVIVGESEKTDTPDEPEVPTTPEEPENPSDNCSCKCHKTGFFAKLIWKITILFNKLFKKNKTCSCGVYHY